MPLTTPELNTPQHRWYQRRNHIRLAREDESRQYLDAASIPSAGSGFVTPSVIATAGTGTGAALAFPASVVGDLLIHWNTIGGSLVIPALAAGYTTIGAGITSDASGIDAAARLSAKVVAAPAEGIPLVSGGSRGIGVLVRNMDPAFLADLSGDYVLDGTVQTGLKIPALTPVRAVPVMVFVKQGGTATVALEGQLGLTELMVQNAASAECRVAWTVASTAAYAGGTIGTLPSTTQGRAAACVALLGKVG